MEGQEEAIGTDGESRVETTLEGQDMTGLAHALRNIFRGRLSRVALVGFVALLGGCLGKSAIKHESPQRVPSTLVAGAPDMGAADLARVPALGSAPDFAGGPDLAGAADLAGASPEEDDPLFEEAAAFGPSWKFLDAEEKSILTQLYDMFSQIKQLISALEKELEGKDIGGMKTIEEVEALEANIAEFEGKIFRLSLENSELIKILRRDSRLGVHFQKALDYFESDTIKKTSSRYAALIDPIEDAAEAKYMEHIQTLSDDNFDQEVLQSSDVYIVMASVDWCEDCHQALPLTAQFGRSKMKGVKIGRVVLEDFDQNTVNARVRYYLEENGIIGEDMPTYIFFVNGRVMGRHDGPVDDVRDFAKLVKRARDSYARIQKGGGKSGKPGKSQEKRGRLPKAIPNAVPIPMPPCGPEVKIWEI